MVIKARQDKRHPKRERQTPFPAQAHPLLQVGRLPGRDEGTDRGGTPPSLDPFQLPSSSPTCLPGCGHPPRLVGTQTTDEGNVDMNHLVSLEAEAAAIRHSALPKLSPAREAKPSEPPLYPPLGTNQSTPSPPSPRLPLSLIFHLPPSSPQPFLSPTLSEQPELA
jgi:hypothetical protein